ncbi:hypothetical protein [Symbiopectobacterium purcellii]|uniref:hypothetical protein n=1 Tax=Symbiopectobacterium purcellii TaxID=2871826 RepID=UPI003F84148D
MIAKNDFLPFATADGANVLSADEYQKLTSRSNGFSAGVARSQELNTVWRQASVIAHVVAQFIADTNIAKRHYFDNSQLCFFAAYQGIGCNHF